MKCAIMNISVGGGMGGGGMLPQSFMWGISAPTKFTAAGALFRYLINEEARWPSQLLSTPASKQAQDKRVS